MGTDGFTAAEFEVHLEELGGLKLEGVGGRGVGFDDVSYSVYSGLVSSELVDLFGEGVDIVDPEDIQHVHYSILDPYVQELQHFIQSDIQLL